MNSNTVYKFGLVGCGKIAERHANLLRHGNVAGAKLAAVCDINEERARSMAEKHDVIPFTSIDEMMQSDHVDVVSVLTPSGLHANNVLALARHGKPIVVEKPMALTLDDADRMIEACDTHGTRLFVIKQNRFNQPVVALRRALKPVVSASWFWERCGCDGVGRRPTTMRPRGVERGRRTAVFCAIRRVTTSIFWSG